jgi:hypothetical protein
MKPILRYLSIFLSVWLMSVYIQPLPSLLTAEPQSQQEGGLSMWRVKVTSPESAQRLIRSGWDVLEAREGDTLFVIGDKTTAIQMRNAGYEVALQNTLPTQRVNLANETDTPGTFFGGYRTVTEHYSHLDSVVSQYPQLARVIVYGESWRKANKKPNGFDLKAICITKIRPNSNDCELIPTVSKPRFFLMAAIHARELTTSELAWRWIDYLVTEYGKDVEVTTLLEQNEMWVVPVTNPDGRHIVEQNNVSPYMQRKNANNTRGDCSAPPTLFNQHGIDLNRNASFQWGGLGTSTDPCQPVYIGTAPASEPEQIALENLLKQLFRDQRGEKNSDAAPENTTGIFLTLHSYSNLILFPWGWVECDRDACNSQQRTNNDESLRSLAFRMSYFNNYETGQPSEMLYAASGTTDDWAYGTLGVASFTFEVGPVSGECAGFAPAFSCQESFWRSNLPAFMYAAKVANAPYTMGRGPSVLTPTLNIAHAFTGQTVTLSAIVSDNVYGKAGVDSPQSQTIARAEVSLNTPFGAPNVSPTTMTALDGAFDSDQEAVIGNITAPLAPGLNVIYARGCDSQNFCGPAKALWLNVYGDGKMVYLPIIKK